MSRYQYVGAAGAVLLGITWDDSQIEGAKPTTGPLEVRPGDIIRTDSPLAEHHPALVPAPKPEPKPKDDK